MPQMFPLMWLSLFLLSALMLFSMMTLLFFFSKPSNKTFSMNPKMMTQTWKW